ncbi:MAG: maleylpyruvate isomerase family mycothiol-dependent enzyme [Actinomycetota bacterium]
MSDRTDGENMSEMEEAVALLAAEQKELEELLRRQPPEAWLTLTPAAGWDVRDQVSHLADTEEIAYDTTTGGPRQLNREALSFTSPEAFTESGCDKGRKMQTAEVLEWWVSGAARTRDALEGKDPKERVPWGLGMAARTLVTARMMETWAHGLDIRAALGEKPNLTPRLRDIAWLIFRALPYGFNYAKREMPAGTLRLELDFDGERWVLGPEDADNVITGDAEEFCRLGVQRLKLADTTTLKVNGRLAEEALQVARAFL